MQVCAHRGGLLGRSAGVGGRFLRGLGSGGGDLTGRSIGLHLIGRLSGDCPLEGQLVDQLLRGGCGQHRRQPTIGSTHVGHRGHPVGRGLVGRELGVRGLERRQVGAVAFFGGRLGSQSVVGIALGSRDGLASLQRLTGQIVELGQRVSRRIRLHVARHRQR